jgi:Fe-S-cluster containining protein
VKLKVVEPWYADGLRFECTGCGGCCTGGPGFIWISDEEIARLAKHLDLSREEVLKRYCRKISGQISLKEKPRNERGEYDCIFLEEVPAEAAAEGQVTHSKRICRIYAVRPLQCRTFPFWDGNLQSQASWEVTAKRCPGMNCGRQWSAKEIEAMRDAKDWP